MSNIEKSSEPLQTDFFLDITGEVCPLTFVRTKLLIERMSAGQTALIRLKGAEPLANVPRSIEAAGHAIEAFAPEDPEADTAAVHRMVIRKR